MLLELKGLKLRLLIIYCSITHLICRFLCTPLFFFTSSMIFPFFFYVLVAGKTDPNAVSGSSSSRQDTSLMSASLQDTSSCCSIASSGTGRCPEVEIDVVGDCSNSSSMSPIPPAHQQQHQQTSSILSSVQQQSQQTSPPPSTTTQTSLDLTRRPHNPFSIESLLAKSQL